ncbi:hypothetical protein [Kaistia terrae]|uniref:Transposase n=1 Tax=Kaistia terrae TaxID=537017 RepID=A0ABW0Q1A3_9HYPH|nr:hypothetical protein [Kaistia terrae]MCX5578920.1 hypothetical protein [Kaistia terrae]
MVVASALIPKRSGERIKTNRREAAVTLPRLHRAGELTGVWVPDVVHEVVRDLVRVGKTAGDDLRRKRQQLLSFLLRHGRIYEGGGHWTWRTGAGLPVRASSIWRSRLSSGRKIDTIEDAAPRLHRLDEQLRTIVPTWSMARVVEACQALRTNGHAMFNRHCLRLCCHQVSNGAQCHRASDSMREPDYRRSSCNW